MREIIKKTTEIKTPETWDIEKVEERLHDKDGVKDEHTHIELARDDEGELRECLVTRCKQLDSLLQERRETLFSLEADHDQVGPVELCEVQEIIATNGYTRSLGGIEAPGTLVGMRFPSVSVPVCVYTSVAKCVLQRTHSGSARAYVRATPCAKETACVDEAPCVKETPCVEATPCVSGVVASVPKYVPSSTPCVTETPCVEEAPRVKEAVCVCE